MTIQTVFSVTEIDSYQRCRRKWDYSSLHRQSLEAKRPNPALELGSMVHKALELWDKPLSPHKICPNCQGLLTFTALGPGPGIWQCSSCDHFEGPPALEDAFEEVARDTIAKLVTPETEDDFAAKQQDLLDLGKGMMSMYRERYGSEISDVFTVVSSEQEVRIPVPGATYYDVHGGTGVHQLYLEGTIDKLLQHKEWGTLYILDHKTFGRHPNEYELALTQQFPRYVYMARLLGWEVVGIAYDGIWKRDSIPRGKSMDDMFLRKLLTYSNDEIEETGRFLAAIMTEMADPDTTIYHTPRQGCWDCDFRNLCLAQSRGEDVDYILQEYFQPRRSNKDKRLDDI